MKQITTICIIIVTIFTISCSRKNYTMKDISGRYSKSDFELYWGLNLNTDSTFQYNWQGGLMFGKTHGKWRLEKNKIILNSEFQPTKEKQKKSFLRNASLSGNSNSLYLKILDESLDVIPFASCNISFENKEIIGKTADLDGFCMLEWKKGMTLKITGIGYVPIQIVIPDSANYLEFVLVASNDLVFYKYFTDYKVKILKNCDLLFEKYDNKIWRLFHRFDTRLILNKKQAFCLKSQKADTALFPECKDLYMQEKYKECFDCYQRHDTNINAIYNMALVSDLLNNKKDFKKFSKTLILKENRSPWSYGLYADLFAKKDSSKYLRKINKGLRVFKYDTILLNYKANYYLHKNDNKRLIPAISQLLYYSNWENKYAYHARGYAFMALKKDYNALADFNKAIEIDSLYYDAYYNIAIIYLNQAVDLYDLSMKEKDNDKYLELKEKADAALKKSIPYFLYADQIRPNEMEILDALKQIYKKLGRNEEYEEIKRKIENANKD
jgi:hypothetical protein